MADDVSFSGSSDHELPIRVRRRAEGLARGMKRSNQLTGTRQLLVGMRGRPAVHEGEDLYVARETQWARCTFEARVVNMPEQRVHCGRPVPSSPTDRVTTPLHRGQASAAAHSRSMAARAD